jgi:hypothetical protein
MVSLMAAKATALKRWLNITNGRRSMTRQQRMIEAFAAHEASIRERIDRENIDVLVEMGWTRSDAAMFVGENPIEGGNDARWNNNYNPPQIQATRRSSGQR